MPFDTPTLPALIQRADADLSAAAAETLRRSDQVALTRVHAGAASELHGHLKWNADQILPDKCDEDMLVRYGKLRLKVPRRDAAAATGPVLLPGQTGAVIDAGEILQVADGRRYAVAAAVTFTGPQASVLVTAVDAGKLGNVAAGAQISLVSPVLGVGADGVVGVDGISGGTDQESVEELRGRVLRSYRVVPQGGAADDYVTWAREVPGITRAWCVRNYMGPGTVGLFVMSDDAPNPFPEHVSLDAVKDHIASTRPVTAELYVLAPARAQIDFVIKAIPDSSALRAAIEKALADLLRREGDLGVTVPRTHLAEAISQSPGEDDHVLVAPAANVPLARNAIPVLGDIAWQ